MAGVVVVAGLVVLALFLTGVLGGDDEGSSPTDVADRYLQALIDGDRAAAGNETRAADRAGLSRQIADFARLEVIRFRVGQYHGKDATHVVVNAVVVTRQDTSDERPMDLPKVRSTGRGACAPRTSPVVRRRDRRPRRGRPTSRA